MSVLKKAAIVTLGAVTSVLYLAIPAAADPDPCGTLPIFICRMVPIAPDLDHDVDLTQDPSGLTDGRDGQSAADQPGAVHSGQTAAGQPAPVHSGG
ncbi:hypothetical protein [Mycobacterium sp.]|jgi:hypothetical protein|uniref:hypothetical protein n=1 Tax=Mycobacterium sp. TaxID=1785 RepID=UPI002B7C4FDE|nr:hypothetical protein [Mycobacterium sp.]HXB88402.1 hypothetical protein [Mycobacterium sp.]